MLFSFIDNNFPTLSSCKTFEFLSVEFEVFKLTGHNPKKNLSSLWRAVSNLQECFTDCLAFPSASNLTFRTVEYSCINQALG